MTTPSASDPTSVTDPREVNSLWQEVYAGDSELGEQACRLALGMLLYGPVFSAVEQIGGHLRPARGFVASAARLAARVRVTPLLYLVEHDPVAAAFVVRHPHAVADLLREQGDVFGDRDEEGLTHRVRRDLAAFLRRMKVIAPLLLERAGIERRHTEKFLQFVHTRSVLDDLRQSASVRDRLGQTLLDFWRMLGAAAAPPPDTIDRQTVDNILWQVAFSLAQARNSQDSTGWAAIEQEVAGRLRRQPAEVAYRAAAAAANASDIFESIRAEFESLT